VKKILSVNKPSAATDIALLVARIGIAALMLTHGIPKLMMLISGAPLQFPSVMGMSRGFQ
jgi:putative oxidoreductase